MDDRIEYIISHPKDDPTNISEQKCFKIIGKKDDLIGYVTVTDGKTYISLNNYELVPIKSSYRRREIEY